MLIIKYAALVQLDNSYDTLCTYRVSYPKS
jgi:hypothetical protein